MNEHVVVKKKKKNLVFIIIMNFLLCPSIYIFYHLFLHIHLFFFEPLVPPNRTRPRFSKLSINIKY